MRCTIITAGLLAAAVLTACGTADPAGSAGSAKPSESATAAPTTASRAAGTPRPTPPTAQPPTTAKPTTAKPRAPQLIRVPRVVGHNHQTAQNEMQAAGLHMLREKDATGRGRLLLWDRNWVVVRQSPAPGERVAPDTTITLYSKKIGE
ncbi:PASTA domain-containing protein [Actinomadura litoris]|uniref:PASTA domain-containing protein n=1 Tax=Actinomadura litoris TaxID=2678616 RepID=A0A7K1L006_9ACTN|nr:PASTA domain-containing protein [Actinomadura litoris]MUN37667.1 PASTA domain-containing protein [Actinomadura litoris]